MKKILFAVTTLFFCILGVFIAGEIITRIFPGYGFLYLVDSELHHTPRPYLNIKREWKGKGKNWNYITNSLGWRDKVANHEIKKITEREKRLIFVGDSFVEASGFDYEETFVAFAEDTLSKNGTNFEVLNAGTSSYSPLLEYQRMKRFFDQGYKADIVLQLVDLSDFADEVIYHKRYKFDETQQYPRFKNFWFCYPWVVSALNSSTFFRFIARYFVLGHYLNHPFLRHTSDSVGAKIATQTESITSEELVSVNSYLERLLKPLPLSFKPSYLGWAQDGIQLLRKNIVKMKKLCAKNGALYVLVYYPWPVELYTKEDPSYYAFLLQYFKNIFGAYKTLYGNKPYPIPSHYEELMQSICVKEKLGCINLYPTFREKEQLWHTLFTQGDFHFSETGHRVVGEALTKEFLKKFGEGEI